MPHHDDRPASSGHLPESVLIVEDNLIIALDVELSLLEMGVKTVRSANSVAAALSLIAIELPEFALLDINLEDETSLEVAHDLARRGIPFALMSGYGDKNDRYAPFQNVPRLAKPYSIDELRALLSMRGPSSGD